MSYVVDMRVIHFGVLETNFEGNLFSIRSNECSTSKDGIAGLLGQMFKPSALLRAGDLMERSSFAKTIQNECS